MTVGAVAAAPLVLGAAGFTAGGIAAGSIASSMMSSAAVAGGGGVAAGSLVAALQAAGEPKVKSSIERILFFLNYLLLCLLSLLVSTWSLQATL